MKPADPSPELFSRRFTQHRLSKLPLPPAESLRKIRKLRRVSQVILASRLETGQAEISRFERRADLRVGSIRSYIEALGGSLDLVARFPGLVIRIDLPLP